MFREDYLMRLIHQLGDVIARMAGLNRKGEHDQALEVADQVWGKLLDAPRALIEAVDSATLAGMLREPAKIRAAAQLCREEGDALAGKADPVHAQLRYRRALELVLAARALEPSPDDEAMVLALSRRAPAGALDPR